MCVVNEKIRELSVLKSVGSSRFKFSIICTLEVSEEKKNWGSKRQFLKDHLKILFWRNDSNLSIFAKPIERKKNTKKPTKRSVINVPVITQKLVLPVREMCRCVLLYRRRTKMFGNGADVVVVACDRKIEYAKWWRAHRLHYDVQ